MVSKENDKEGSGYRVAAEKDGSENIPAAKPADSSEVPGQSSLGGLDYQFGLLASDFQPLGLEASGLSITPITQADSDKPNSETDTGIASEAKSETKFTYPSNTPNRQPETPGTTDSQLPNLFESSEKTVTADAAPRTNFQRMTAGKLPVPQSKKSQSRGANIAPIVLFFALISLGALVVPRMFRPAEESAFDSAKHAKPWAYSKVAMRDAINLAILKETDAKPANFVNDELVEFGEILTQHGEHEDALRVWNECMGRPNKDNLWTLKVIVHRGETEEQLCRIDKNFQPNTRALLRNLDRADRAHDIQDKAKILQILGAISYDQHKEKEGDQYFERAEKEIAPLAIEKLNRHLYEAWWSARMHQTVEKLKLLPKPQPTTLTLEHGRPLLENKAMDLLTSQKFDELTKLFENEERNRKAFWGGSETIDDLYQIADVDRKLPEPKWMERKALIQKWIAAKPDSPIPHMVLADFYNNYAWLARSGSTVTDKDFAVFKRRIMDGERELNKALDWKNVAPEWFTLAQTNYLGGTTGKNSKPDYDTIVAIGHADYPDRTTIFTSKSWFLQPRWFGEDDEWVKFATDVSNSVGGDDGDRLYYRLIAYNMNTYSNKDKDIWAKFPGLNHARYDRGQKLLARDFPEFN